MWKNFWMVISFTSPPYMYSRGSHLYCTCMVDRGRGSNQGLDSNPAPRQRLVSCNFYLFKNVKHDTFQLRTPLCAWRISTPMDLPSFIRNRKKMDTWITKRNDQLVSKTKSKIQFFNFSTKKFFSRGSYSIMLTHKLKLISLNTGYCDKTNL